MFNTSAKIDKSQNNKVPKIAQYLSESSSILLVIYNYLFIVFFILVISFICLY